MRYEATIISGKGRGKKLGFPTINLRIPERFDFPFGIYAGHIKIGSQQFRAAFHYGPIPTFNHSVASLEAFALDASLASLPKNISFELLAYVREIKKCSSSEGLSLAIAHDVLRAKTILTPLLRRDRAQ
jgi:riboflavin kinase/FMN adenylyltransferase